MSEENKNNPNALTQEELDKLLSGVFNEEKKATLTQDGINEILGGGDKVLVLDNLTQCKDSTMFSGDFDAMLANAGEKYTDVTLAIIDIDNFKHVNDDFGHKTGDDVLSEIGKILLAIEAEKSVYRYSGDEFTILFPDMEKEQAFLIMEKTREAVSKAPECTRTATTISVGIATYNEDGTRRADLVRKAEGALYRAKSTGRNKVALAKEEKLVTKTIHFTVEQLKRLKELSDDVSIGEAALMREALDDLLKKYNEKKMPEPTVLIIDDAAFMRMMIKDILTKNGYKVVGEAIDGKEGFEKFTELNPDFVILDITMPNVDGITFLKKIEKKPKNHIIMVSAMGQVPYVIESYKQGADAFIVKPFQADTLINVMSNLERYSVPKDCFDKFAEVIAGYENVPLSQEQINKAVDISKIPV